MKLSVLMITYNHEKYLAKAIDSALMQETDFEFEIVLGEDCSTDSTRSIVLEYLGKYPGRIKALLPEKNLGMMRNLIETFNCCEGEYIALLEGDDFWNSPHKLQRQVDVLDKNKDVSLCFHNTYLVDDDLKVEKTSNVDQAEVTDIFDILQGWYIMTASMVFRKNAIGHLPDWFLNVRNGDYALQLLLANKGKIFYLDEPMASYRRHEAGASKKFFKCELQSALAYLLYNFDQYTNGEHHKPISRRLSLIFHDWIEASRIVNFPRICYYAMRYKNFNMCLVTHLFRRVLHI